MKVAIISTPFEASPPAKYGGAERIAGLLAGKLTARGHDVTLFATGDSKTDAKLVSFYDRPIRPYNFKFLCDHCAKAFRIIQDSNFDVVHNHTYFATCYSPLSKVPFVTTIQGDVTRDEKDSPTIFEMFSNEKFVAVSNRQFEHARGYGINVISRIYNSIDSTAFEYSPNVGQYLAFLGTIQPQKGPLTAIKVAQRTGIPLKIAAKYSEDAHSKDYFEKEVKPHIDGSFIEFLGELDHKQKTVLLKNALALLFPIEWEEPFGIVMIEAMACGTPVVAFARGSVPEVVQHDVTGFVVDNIEEMIGVIPRIPLLPRHLCRQQVKDRFDLEEMVSHYENLYALLQEESKDSFKNW